MSGALQAVFQNQRSFVSVPGAPTIGTATATGLTTATVSYTAPANNGGSTITLYTATSSPGGITGTLAQAGSGTISISGLTTGTAYTFTVTATNAIGTSAASAASNSITPVAAGFLATIKYLTQATAGQSLTTNSSGTIYQRIATNVYQVAQISSTGAINSSAYNYLNEIYGLVTDSSNNYYVFGAPPSGSLGVLKYNSSDVFQWGSKWDETSDLVEYSPTVVDSSGNLYVSIYQSIPAACCTSDNYIIVRKINASSVTGFTLNYGNVGGGTTTGNVGVDSSGNIYTVAMGSSGTGYTTALIYKVTSAFANSAKKNYAISGPLSIEISAGIFDVTNTVGYAGGRVPSSSVAFIMKYDSTCTSAWAYKTATLLNVTDCAVDSSGNVYVIGTVNASPQQTGIIKINSSGTLQWARTISNSTYRYSSGSISISGSKFVVGGSIQRVGQCIASYAVTFEAPIDGTSTGTFTNDGLTWTYASYSETLTSLTLVNYTNASVTTNSIARNALSSPTLTSATLTATTTQF